MEANRQIPRVGHQACRGRDCGGQKAHRHESNCRGRTCGGAAAGSGSQKRRLVVYSLAYVDPAAPDAEARWWDWASATGFRVVDAGKGHQISAGLYDREAAGVWGPLRKGRPTKRSPRNS